MPSFSVADRAPAAIGIKPVANSASHPSAAAATVTNCSPIKSSTYWCRSGVVVYEMAQQLQASGEPVGLLALLDTYAGNLSSISSTIMRLLMHPSRQTIFGELPAIIGEAVQRRFKSLMTSRVLKHVQQTNQAAGDRYVLRPYAGRITLFRATEASLRSFEDLYTTWTKLAGAGLEVQKISGNHKGILVKPQVDQLAAKLKACIDEGTPSARAVSPSESHLAASRRPVDSSKLQPTL